jgi:PKD repeat protein
MKTRKLLTMTAAIAAAALIAGVQSATAQSLGFNFVTNSAGGVITSVTDSDTLLSGESAGAPPNAQMNWNNLSVSGGSSTYTVTDSTGATHSMPLQWSAYDKTIQNTLALGTPDGKLFNLGLSTWGPGAATPLGNSCGNSSGNNQPLVYIGGLNAWLTGIAGAEGYNVVLYTCGAEYWEGIEGYVESVSGDPLANTMVEGTSLLPHLYGVDNSTYSGTYVPITSTNSGSPTYGANYMSFNGLTNDAILLRLQTSGYGQGLDGFQIIPIFPTIPTAGDPTFNPSSTVYAGVPVTLTEVATGDLIHKELFYQWRQDTNSDYVVTNLIVDATNSTYSFTPPNAASTYTISFDVIVTNVFGAATSSVVTLTVNPAVAPYVTSDTAPATAYAFANGSQAFSAAFGGPIPITYQWEGDTGSGYASLSNATNTTLVLTNLQFSDAGNYRLMAHNVYGDTPSTPAALTVLADPAAPDLGQAYAYAVFTNNPVAFWRFSETIDSTAGASMQAYDYSGHNFNATYGNQVYNQQPGPSPSSYPVCPGLESTNTSIAVVNGANNSWLDVPALNLNTNTVTITAWINPSGVIGGNWGLFMWRGTNGDAAGLGFGSTVVSGVAELGYNWNSNSASAYNFHSGLYAPLGQWSFVALTITPTNSTLYLYYTDGFSVTNLSKAVNPIAHSSEAFSGGTIRIGSDNYSGRNFNGNIDEVAVFNQSLSEAQLQNLFAIGSGITGVAPYINPDISANPTNSSNLFPGQIAVQLIAGGAGMPVPGYQWQAGSGGVFTNLVDGGSFSGVNSGTLTINPVMPANYLDYRLVLANVNGSATSSVYHVNQVAVPDNGLWIARYQFTNSSGYLWYDAYGSGSYSGPGVLGSGNFWNPIPGHGQWNGGNFTSASDYMDDGSTHSGVICRFNNASFSIAGAPQVYASNDRRGLLSQFAYYTPGAGVTVTNAIVLNVPNGTFNLALHGDNANWSDRGTLFTVHGANGDKSDMTTNTTQYTYFVNHDSSVVITNIQVTNGVLNVDAAPTPVVPNHSSNSEFAINAVEVQLVSYSAPTAGFSASATNVFVGQWFAFNDQSSIVTNVVWDFGDGSAYTNVNGTVYHGYSTPGTYTVSQTVTGPGGTDSVTKTAYIHVVAKPAIGGLTMTGTGSLVLSGGDGIEGQQYRILTSSDVALPLASWTPVMTNVFGTGGSYNYTNSSPTNSASYFILVTP